MLINDEKKTKELLKGLDSKGVQVTNLSEYLMKQCIYVDVHQSLRADRRIDITDIVRRRNSLSEESINFLNTYQGKNYLSIFPKNITNKIQSICGSVRAKKFDCSFNNNGLMLMDVYKDSFKPYYLEKKEELEATINGLELIYEESVNSFQNLMHVALNELDATLDEIALIQSQVEYKLPKKHELKDLFSLTIELKAMPVITSLSIFDNEINEDIKASLIDTSKEVVFDIIGKNLSIAFNTISKVMEYYKIALHFKDSDRIRVKNMKDRLKKENLLKNEMVDVIIKEIEESLSVTNDDDILAETLELISAKIYKFSKETETLNTLDLKNSALTVEELEQLISFM